MSQKLKQYRDRYNHAKSILEAKNFVLFDEMMEFDRSDELEDVMINISILNKVTKEMTETIDRICGDFDGSKHLNRIYNIYGNAILILEDSVKGTDAVLTNVIGMKYFKNENTLDKGFKKNLAAITTGVLCTWSRMIDQLAKLGH